MPSGGKQSSIEPGLISAVGAGMRGMVDNWLNGWFGPGEPTTPVGPKDMPARVQDYPVGVNLRYQPRGGELVGYDQMRLLADQYDLLRLVIETRKAQIAKMPWSIRVKDKPGQTDIQEQQADNVDARIPKLTEFFNAPDGEQSTWQTWLNQVLEEILVVDALSIYPSMNVEVSMQGMTKTPERLEVIDGATIKRIVDTNGRTPRADADPPNNVAYQQILKGVVATQMTTDQLVYRPMNVRAHKMYGYSPVEQIIMTINIALRRQISTLNYYTEGNVPEALCQLPSDWSPDDCKRFQEWFDSMLAGNLANRRKMIFLPGSGTANNKASITFTKDQVLKDEADEWLARVICYAFSVPPTALSKMVNRASGQQMQETAIEEGLLPLMTFVKGVVDYIIKKYFGFADLEFNWEDDAEEDSLKAAQVNDIYVKNGIMSIDEVREKLGLPALGIENGIVTATGFVPLTVAVEQAETSLEASKTGVEGAKKALTDPPPDSKGQGGGGQPDNTPPPNKAKQQAAKLAKKKLKTGMYTSPSPHREA